LNAKERKRAFKLNKNSNGLLACLRLNDINQANGHFIGWSTDKSYDAMANLDVDIVPNNSACNDNESTTATRHLCHNSHTLCSMMTMAHLNIEPPSPSSSFASMLSP
jgi:hypothetical protein